MLDSEKNEIIDRIEKRISEIEKLLSDCSSVSEKKRSQAGDASANLDLTINTAVEEKIVMEHKLELVQLRRNAAWLQTDEAGECILCGCKIPVGRMKVMLTTQLCVSCVDEATS